MHNPIPIRSAGLALFLCVLSIPSPIRSDDIRELVGYWKLRGDCRDYSGHENHGVNHDVRLADSEFNGIDSYIEIPASESLNFGAGNFTLTANIWTAHELDDNIGDVFERFDPVLRRGWTLSVDSTAGGYQGQGNDRHVYFGIDNSRLSDWQDCGRPNPTSNYVSNSLTVFRGRLYAATTDAKDERDWCHVYRYEGRQQWSDCGRVGVGRTTGVGPLVVHDDNLYAVTWTYDWTRVKSGKYDAGRVYRYQGGSEWEDCGQPSDNRTLNCAASFQGKLYVGGGPETWGVFELPGDQPWRDSILFPKTGPQRCFPHTLQRFNGKLYVAYPGVYAYDGKSWEFSGIPSTPVESLQTHSLHAYQGKLCAGTWPDGKVARYLGGEKWEEIGRVGADGTEVNSLVVYNGKLYGGSIPRAEVCRFDDAPQWTSIRRFYSPNGWTPASPSQVGGSPTHAEVNEWSRVTSLTIFDGKLFASIGSCTSSILDAPADDRGRVFSMEAGKCVSYDGDLGPGWKHMVAVRDGGQLRLYIDGQRVAQSSRFEASDFDVSNDQPMRIGFGPTDYFSGKICEVRAYRRALSDEEIQDRYRSDLIK